MVETEFDLIRILGGIYIGGLGPIIKHIPLRAQYNITHILSVIRFDVIPEYLVKKSYTLKNIPIDDDDSTDILEHFNETNRFIDQCLFPNELEYNPKKADFRKKPQKGAIYIHCHAGISRSAAFTVAYLMYRYGFNLKTSLHALKRRNAQIQPNDNFMEQLKIYESMGGQFVDANNKDYNQWRLSNSLKADAKVTELLADDWIYHETNEAELAKMTDDELDRNTALKCKKCRQLLALSISFIGHSSPTKNSSEGHFIRRAAGSRRVIDIQQSQDQCSHFFVEPLSWMKKNLQNMKELEGKFSCPSCSTKVGGYNWKGSRCSCGKWVNPAIHLLSAKVDHVALKKKTLPNIVNFHGIER